MLGRAAWRVALAVPCPACGREYDVTLFEFGRTIWCTCGSRVGLAPRIRNPDAPGKKQFIADAMLGKLARWLRLLGFDCEYDREISDSDLVQRGVSDGRIILSRDRSLEKEWWVSGIYLVAAENTRDQLIEVLQRFELANEIRLFTRCAECNLPLHSVDTDLVRERVPADVLDRQDSFSACRECGRVYWEGSHTERIQRFVDQLLAVA